MVCFLLEEKWYINKANIHINVIYLFMYSFIRPFIHHMYVAIHLNKFALGSLL